jgi:hypothetical protein
MRTQRPLGRSHGRLRKLALVTFATTAAAGLSSTAANAAVTGTSITSPTSYQVLDANLGTFSPELSETPELPEFPQTRVTGTATTSGASDNAVQVFVVIPLKRLGAMAPIIPIDISEPIPVGPDGSFAVDVNTPPINSRIVALPVALESEEQALPAFFDEGGPFRPTTVLGGIAASVSAPGLGGFSLAVRGQRQGFGLISPAGFANLGFGESPISSFGLLGGITSGAIGAAEGDFALNFMGAGGISSNYNASRGGLTVDGSRAYLRDHIPVGTDVLPAPTTERSVDFQTGGQTVVETQDVYLAANAADDPYIVPLEGGYRPSGLQLQRTSVQDHDGRQISVTDRFRSTNGAAHKIDVLYAEGLTILPYDASLPFGLGGGGGCGILCFPTFEGPLAGLNPPSLSSISSLAPLDESEGPQFPTFEPPAFRIPWETGSQWEARSHADAMTAPGTATSTVFTRLPNVSALLGAFTSLIESEGEAPAVAVPSTYGAITYGTRPDSGLFVSDPLTIGMLLGGTSTQYVSRFVRDVPAGGDTTIAQVYSTGTTQAEVEALAAAAEKRLAPAEAPKPAPPVAPPAPPTAAVARKAPRKLSAASKLQRTKSGQYRFRFTGRLALPSGVSKSACRAGGGTVTLQVKAGSNTISTRRVKLDRNGKYSVRINFRSRARFGKRTRLTVIAKWSGNRALGPKPAKRFTVKVR